MQEMQGSLVAEEHLWEVTSLQIIQVVIEMLSKHAAYEVLLSASAGHRPISAQFLATCPLKKIPILAQRQYLLSSKN